MALDPPVYHHDIEQGTPEWHDLRRGCITASKFSLLITTKTLKPADNDTSRKHLYSVLAERLTGQIEEEYRSDDMLRGNMEEDDARQVYIQHRHPVHECGFVTRTNHGVTIGYSPDGLVGKHGLIEIKRPRQQNQILRILEDKLPDAYFWQVHVGMAVTGRKWCDFISYAPGLNMMILREHAKPDIQEAIWTAAIAAEDFIKDMEKQIRTLAETRKYPPTEPRIILSSSDIII